MLPVTYFTPVHFIKLKKKYTNKKKPQTKSWVFLGRCLGFPVAAVAVFVVVDFAVQLLF